VTVPLHVGETIGPGLLRSILNQAGITVEELRDVQDAVEAIEVHIAGLIADGEPVPGEVEAPQLLAITVAA
jgi:predicted RNase H-like HicB family nuclease